MGHRLENRETSGAYTALIYKKGALVLRMMHFLFTDPQTGEGKPFFDMMSDFVRRYKNGTASSEQFFAVANEHVRDTPLAKKYGYANLNWFFRQWVTQTYLPSYELTYHLEDDPAGGGAVLLKGEVTQTGIPENEKWFMPLPLLIHLPGGKTARGTVAVMGSRTPVSIRMQGRPEKVELDPDLWVLSEKTSTAKQ
jgi:aminopeptidase N